MIQIQPALLAAPYRYAVGVGNALHTVIDITAHKDEIGAIVKTVGSEGRVEVRKLGG